MLTARSTSWLLLTRSQQDRQRACSTMYPPSLGTGSPSGIIPNPGGGMLLIGSSQFKFLWARENWAFAQFCRQKGAHRSTRKVLHVSEKDTTWLALSQYFIFVGNTWVQTKCPMFGRGNPLLPTQESLPMRRNTTLKSISHCRHTFCCHYRTWSCWKHHLEILLDLSQRMKQNQKIFLHQTWNEVRKKE